MASLSSAVNKCLKDMKKHKGTGKGTYGEAAVFNICEEFYKSYGGILIHSYEYKVDPDLEGNIKNEGGKLYVENLGTSTEIDVLYISPYRIFPIEVKAYKAKEITLTDKGISGSKITNKSPVHQNEMHCRHLFSDIRRAVPDGDPRFIVPIVVFVDDATIVDNRSSAQRDYIKIAILDTLFDTIMSNNTPLNTRLDLNVAERVLKDNMFSSKIFLPARTIER